MAASGRPLAFSTNVGGERGAPGAGGTEAPGHGDRGPGGETRGGGRRHSGNAGTRRGAGGLGQKVGVPQSRHFGDVLERCLEEARMGLVAATRTGSSVSNSPVPAAQPRNSSGFGASGCMES